MPALAGLLTAMVTAFDARRGRRRGRDRRGRAAPARQRLGRAGGVRHDRRGLDDDRRGAPRRHRADHRRSVGDEALIVGGVGSNDTRHAVHLTEQAAALGVDALLTRHAVLQPAQRARDQGALRRGRQGRRRRAGDRLQRPVPDGDEHAARPAGRAGADRRHRRRSSSPTTTSCRPIDGLAVFAGNDDVARPRDRPRRRRRHLRRQPPRRQRDEAAHGRTRPPRGDRRGSCRTSTPRASARNSPAPTKAGLRLLGIDTGRVRLPLADCDEAELEIVRRALGRRRSTRLSSQAARPPARRAGRDRQEHDRRRVRRPHRRRRPRPALPDGRDARHRPRPARLHLPARATPTTSRRSSSPTATRTTSARCRGSCATSARTRSRSSTAASSRSPWRAPSSTSTSSARSSSRS